MPDRDEAKALLAAIDTGKLIGLRDRALIGMLLFTFARIGAVTAMRSAITTRLANAGGCGCTRKGGKEHTMPVHHTLQDWLDAYLAATGFAGMWTGSEV